MTSSRCRICAHDATSAIELWCRLNIPKRRIADVFGVSERTIGRHEEHARGRDHAVEAQKLVDRAWESGSVRQLIRAEAGLRSAIRLDMVDFSRTRAQLRPPSPSDVEALAASVERAWTLFERQDSVTGLTDALAGVRSAIRSAREARAVTEDTFEATFTDPTGEPLGTASSSLTEFWHAHEVPAEFRDKAFTARVQISLEDRPDLEIRFGDRVLYERSK